MGTGWVEEAWNLAIAKVERMSERIGVTFPHAVVEGRYNQEPVEWWTNGFWPGILWIAYRADGSVKLRDQAIMLEEKMDQALCNFYGLHHDVGFMWMLSAVADYQLTASYSARKRGLWAATLLAGRFNPRGRFIRAWGVDRGQDVDTAGWVIVDSLMNMPLLYWASRQTGDVRFQYIAQAHVDSVQREFIRADGSVRHIVHFDVHNGHCVESLAGQGRSADSAWSRGQAWAVYGFALSYRDTGTPAYLSAAQEVATFVLAHLPSDGVPFWDFNLPDYGNQPRDTSAAACLASGLIELSQLAPTDSAQTFYYAAADRIVQALFQSYFISDMEQDGLLRDGAANVPDGQFVGCPLIYGDYFYLEALAKLRGLSGFF